MGYRLDLPLVQHQGRLDQCFAVTGGAGADDRCAVGKKFVNFFHGFDRRFQRTTVVVIIERIQKRSVFSNESNFCRRGTGINTEEDISLVIGEISFFNGVIVVACRKVFVFFLRSKQWFHTGYFKFHMNRAAQFVQ